MSGATNGPNSGLVNFVITPVANGTSGKILITGAIGDYGTIRTVGTKSSSLQRVILKKGSFIFDEFALQVASQDHQPAIDPSNCSFRVVSGSTGAVTLSKGTGLYKDVSGTLSATDTFAAIDPMRNGKCIDNGHFVAQSESIIGSGPVNFNDS